jgi:hypothetical protein
MSDFVLSIVSSIVSSALIVVAGWFFTKKFKKQLIVAFGRLIGSGLEYVYPREIDAAADMSRAVRRSETVRMLSMRAFRLLKDDAPLAFMLREECPAKEVRVLLADPNSLAVAKRAEEFLSIDPSYTTERYIEDIRWSSRQVAENHRNTHLSMRLHKEPAFVRLLITDDFLFLSFFLRDVHGDNSRVFRISRLSPIYESYCRYFDWIWFYDSVPFAYDTLSSPQNTSAKPAPVSNLSEVIRKRQS